MTPWSPLRSFMSRPKHPPRPYPPLLPVAGIEALNANVRAVGGRVDELPSRAGRDDDADVRGAWTGGREENEIADLNVVLSDGSASLELLGHGTRHIDTVLAQHVTDESTAIEAGFR